MFGKEIYTSPEEAQKEIKRRWNDPILKKKVEDFLNNDIPEVFKTGPCAVMVRDIISPNHEFDYFMNLRKDWDIKTVLLEYSDGKFVAKNSCKYHLCRPHFYEEIGKKKTKQISKCKIVNFNKMEGKPMSKVETINGQNLVDFHHDILKKKYPEINNEDIYNFYEWFNEHRNIDGYYYLHYLALFICHGVLFENFILSQGEKEFTEEKILPSFKKLVEIFGVKPIIVPATPVEQEDDIFWWCYPESVT